MWKKWIVALIAVLTLVVWITVRTGLLHPAWWLVPLVVTVFALLASHLTRVPENASLVTRSSLHGAVRRVVRGPAVVLLVPFLEKAGPVVGTGIRFKQVIVENALHADRLPTTLCFTANVAYRLAPHRVPVRELGGLLSTMLADHGLLVEQCSEYCLRSLLAGTHPAYLSNGRLGRLERHFKQSLESHLGQAGVEVVSVQLLVCPPAGLCQVVNDAEQQQIAFKLQGEQLATVLSALADSPQAAESLAHLELARAFGHNGSTWVALDLAELWKSVGRPAYESSPLQTQFPFPQDRYPGLS